MLNSHGNKIRRMIPVTLATVAALIALAAPRAEAEEASAQKLFASPQEGVTALVGALSAAAQPELLTILGPGAEDLLASGDPVADQKGRARFLKAYGEKHRFEMQNPERVVLVVGNKDYPFPIPIVRQEGRWHFDTGAGREEILDRRIGRNELHTIEVMHAYTEAQREFAVRKPVGGGGGFAQKFASSAGKRDGLYWEAAAGEAASPFGPLLAKAAAEGYTGGLGEDPPEPFHGYFFRILKSQGADAPGGAFDYVADGKMVLGFALVAYPARYGASGIMTFLVNQEGTIYEKDLGPDTAAAAAAITAYDPDPSWHQYEEGAGR